MGGSYDSDMIPCRTTFFLFNVSWPCWQVALEDMLQKRVVVSLTAEGSLSRLLE